MLKLLLLFVSFTLSAQEVVNWKPEMGHLYQNGRYLASANNPSGTSMVTTFSTAANGYIEATIAVSNSSEAAIDFFPGDCTMLLEANSSEVFDLKPTSSRLTPHTSA
jgi:hypothetical protein